MNAFQTCKNTSDVVPLYLPQQLFLKPAARLSVSLQLPNVKKLEKSVSHWEIMEKLRLSIRPDEFSALKVTKTTPEFVRFEAELDNRNRLDKVLSKLDKNVIKLKDFSDLIRLKAAEAKSEFPTRHKWDTFFQEAKDMDEMKPGQRPDTIHISNLPTKWFVPYHLNDEEEVTPSEKMFYRIFEKFGTIRYVDIPICDPYRKKMKDQISGIKNHAADDKEFFEGYVQFKDYIGFTKTMDALKGMKLLRKEEDEALCVNIKVDFDKSKHLSDASIRRREIVRDRLVIKQKEKEEKEKNELDEKKNKEQNNRQKEIDLKTEKEQRRRSREEKRKRKILEKLKINGCDEINDKIAKEEKKLLKVQRKLEAIRIVEELFRRIKDKKDEFRLKSKSKSSSCDELKRLKNMSELEVLTQRQKLHNAIEGRVVLKSILSGRQRSKSQSSSSSDSSASLSNEKKNNEKHSMTAMDAVQPDMVYDPNWYGYPYPMASAPLYPPMRGGYMYPPRGRGLSRVLAGPSRGRPFLRGRGFKSRYRGGYRAPHYPPEVEDEYFKYFSKFLNNHDDLSSRRTRSRSRRRSYTRSRSRRRSYSRSSNSRSRSRGHRSRSYNSRSRSRSRDRRSSRSKSRFTPTSSPKKKKSRSRSKHTSRSRSIDSSKFLSPKQLRKARSRS